MILKGLKMPYYMLSTILCYVIQSLQQGIFCVLNFLAAVLLVFCGQTLVSHSQTLVSRSQSLFPVDGAVRRKKEAGYARPVRPLFHTECYHFQYS